MRVVVCSVLVTAALAASPGTIGTCSRDLDRDGRMETIQITSKGDDDGHPMGGDVMVLQSRNGRLEPVWKQGNLNPWKLQTADVDGDGRHEVVVGVWKKSPRDPVMARRVFVYSWDGKRLAPKWLGSRLARRFDDFALADVNGDGWWELAALETVPDGKHRVALYRWRSFGFDWIGCTPGVKGLAELRPTANGIAAAGPSGQFRLSYAKGKVALIREGKGR